MSQETPHKGFHLAANRSHCSYSFSRALVHAGGRTMATLYTSEQPKLWRRCARRPGGLSLRDVQRDPIATRALKDLMQEYTVAEEKIGLVLTKKTGNMKLFFYDLDDLHQWECVQNHRLVRENERLRVLEGTGCTARLP